MISRGCARISRDADGASCVSRASRDASAGIDILSVDTIKRLKGTIEEVRLKFRIGNDVCAIYFYAKYTSGVCLLLSIN